MTPELFATFGQAIGRLPRPAESAWAAIEATRRHRLAGTDLGPLADRALPEAEPESAQAPRLELADVLFDGEQFIGLARKGLRGSAVSIWQIRDPALRAIALEASQIAVDIDAVTRDAIAVTLQHGSTPMALERARRDLEELFQLGAEARFRGREPLEPRPDRVVIRRGLQTHNVAAVAAGLLASSLPEDIGPRILRLGMRIEAPGFHVPWIARRGCDALNGAVSRQISDGIHVAGSGVANVNRHIMDAEMAVPGGLGRGIAPAALLLADLPDDPRLPPLVLALQVLDAAGELDRPAEDIVLAAFRNPE